MEMKRLKCNREKKKELKQDWNQERIEGDGIKGRDRRNSSLQETEPHFH